MHNYYDTIIVGGGLNGLAAAWQLSQRPGHSILVLEQFTFGHQQGSSHGHSRIIRSTYPDPEIVRLMDVVIKKAWPALQRSSSKKLLHPGSACFFGPEGGLFDQYAYAVQEAGANVDLLNPRQASKIFPTFNFKDVNVLADYSGGLIDAAQTLSTLKSLAESQGTHFLENITVQDIDIGSNPILIETTTGQFQAGSLIITAGAWAARLIPELAQQLKVVKQTVGYFDANIPQQYPEIPVWAYLGQNEDDIFYGLPEFGKPGLKAAKHLTEIEGCNPDHPGMADSSELAVVHTLIKQRFNFPIKSLLSYESCLYTLTQDHNFIIDNHPDNSNVVIAAGFSGHGFKFGPLTGQILAELVMTQKTTITEFNEICKKFAFKK